MGKIRFLILFFSAIFFNFETFSQKLPIRLGRDELISSNYKLIQNKNIALCINQSSRLSNGVFLLDTLIKFKSLSIIKIFSPEHGFFGNYAAGVKTDDSLHPIYKIPIVSLYGKKLKPDKKDLENVDILIFDIQDIGARFYTYISTLYYILEACSKSKVKVIVLDCPNPLGGNYVDGPIVKKTYQSFVGIAPVPICHGMTIGELASFFNYELNLNADLEVIKMVDWKRKYFYDDLQLDFVKPSPNIVNFEAALCYPGTCLLEATNISEGRGTYEPFLIFGSPFLRNIETIKFLEENFNLEGFNLEPTEFTPVSIKGMAEKPNYENQLCKGIKIKIIDKSKFEPVKFGFAVLIAIKLLHPDDFKFKDNWALKLIGDDYILKLLNSNENQFYQILQTIDEELKSFKQKRKKYLLYD